MTSVKVIMDDSGEIATKILRPGGEVMRVLKRHADRVAVRARQLAPVASGATRNSIKVTQNREYSGRFSRGYTVIADVPWSIYVEQGRGPGRMPPMSAIRQWTAYRGIDPGAAYPIARKIGQRGTKAQPFMRPAIEQTKFIG